MKNLLALLFILISSIAVAGIYQADFNLFCTYRKSFSLGFGYRTNDSIIFMIGTNIKQLAIGYSYDTSLNASRNCSGGPHEIMVAYKFKKRV